MKRKILGMCAAAAALGAAAAVIPAQPAQAYQVVQLCVTLQDRFVGITVNGNPLGFPVEGTPRFCTGI